MVLIALRSGAGRQSMMVVMSVSKSWVYAVRPHGRAASVLLPGAAGTNDCAAGFLARASKPVTNPRGAAGRVLACDPVVFLLSRLMAMPADVLSEVLSAVRLTGAVFFDVAAASPWVAEAPPSAQIADAVKPGAQHAIEYHVLTRGSCWITIVDGAPFEPVRLEEGDIAVIPHGEPHVVSSAPGMRAPPDLAAHRRPDKDSDLPYKLRTGAGGDAE